MSWWVFLDECTCGGRTGRDVVAGPYVKKIDAQERAAAADRNWPKDVCKGKIVVEEVK